MIAEKKEYWFALSIVFLTACMHFIAKETINSALFQIIEDEKLKKTVSIIDSLLAFVIPFMIFIFLVFSSKLSSILTEVSLSAQQLATAFGIGFIWIFINSSAAYFVLSSINQEDLIRLNSDKYYAYNTTLPYGYTLTRLALQSNISYILMMVSAILYLLKIYKISLLKSIVTVTLPTFLFLIAKTVIKYL